MAAVELIVAAMLLIRYIDDDAYRQEYAKGNYKFGCERCPPNAFCPEGMIEGDLFQPIPQKGYWIDRAAAARDAK